LVGLMKGGKGGKEGLFILPGEKKRKFFSKPRSDNFKKKKGGATKERNHEDIQGFFAFT